VIAQQIAQLGDLRPGCVTGTSGRCAKLSCRCHQPGEPAHGRHSNTVGRLVSNGEAMACLERLSPVSRMRRARRAIFCGLLPNLDSQAVCGVFGAATRFFALHLFGNDPGLSIGSFQVPLCLAVVNKGPCARIKLQFSVSQPIRNVCQMTYSR